MNNHSKRQRDERALSSADNYSTWAGSILLTLGAVLDIVAFLLPNPLYMIGLITGSVCMLAAIILFTIAGKKSTQRK